MTEKKVKKPAVEVAVATKPEKPQVAVRYIEAVGRRKRAVARVRLSEGNNKKITILINGRDYHDFLPIADLAKAVEDPLRAVGKTDLTVSVKVAGGGIRGQAEAIRHGISRALLKMDQDLRPTLKPLGFLMRDSRKKERKKPGLKRARRAPQWAKR
jgi:small subunit ribosomal protein S9